MIKINVETLKKFAPFAIAAIFAAAEAIGEQKEKNRIEDMEKRIAELEKKN